jgi:hypothetical protein
MSCTDIPVFDRTTTPARAFASYAMEAAQFGPAPSCTTISSDPRPITYQPNACSARENADGGSRLRRCEKAIRNITRQ